MPTQRTTEITFSKAECEMIRLAARGMWFANDEHDHSSTTQAYGGFRYALDKIMLQACGFDTDFMDRWECNRVQGSLSLSLWEQYPEQIREALVMEGVEVKFAEE